MSKVMILYIISFLLFILLDANIILAQPLQIPPLQLDINSPEFSSELTIPLQIMLLLTLLSFLPAMVIAMTSFVRIVVVLSLLRQALGIQQIPPNPVLIGLALFMTFFIMRPVGEDINTHALQPYIRSEINIETALKETLIPLRKFMLRQTNEEDLGLFLSIREQPRPHHEDEIDTVSIIPAFIISELKTAFQVGFLLYMPFLILDLVIASILVSVGMIMLPPVLISLPFKLMLFVLVDGWHLIVGSLVRSFQ